MSGTGPASFHIAYCPAASRDDTNNNCNGDGRTCPPVAIRRASYVRLYRCRGHHAHKGVSIGKEGHLFTDHPYYGKGSAESSEHHVDDDCHCCCCRAERCSPDSLLASRPSAASRAPDNSVIVAANMMLAVLVPSSLTQNLIDIVDDACNNKQGAWSKLLTEAGLELRKSIHPCLCPSDQNHKAIGERSLFVCGVVTSNGVTDCINFPADVVLLAPETTHGDSDSDREQIISHYSNLLNHETASDAPWSVIKAFPASTLSILPTTRDPSIGNAAMNRSAKGFDTAALPCCPVCLNLIEPTRLGLPELKPHHKCSRWCWSSDGNFNEHNGFATHQPCPNEMKLLPWPPPAECAACQQRMRSVEMNVGGYRRSASMDSPFSSPTAIHNNTTASLKRAATEYPQRYQPLTCNQCSHSTTLWVCLSCGVVGCGRYTLKHAAEHYTLEGHPYSLELATGRIWNYDNGDFVHRKDLVECPVLSMKWGIAGGESATLVAPSSPRSSLHRGDSNSFSDTGDRNGWRKQESNGGLSCGRRDGLEDSVACHNGHNHASGANSKLSAQPKKSIMLSEEYEALLQSALEDQAMHYEGELSRIRAELASSRIQSNQISDREAREIRALQKDSERLKQEAARLSSSLLEAQAIEAKHRSMSQRLLREQSISKELLERIRKETLAEHESGKLRVEDLEMQIADLTANLSVMSQFAKNEELSQAQIFGTIGGEETAPRQRGKKKNRRGRKRG